MSEAEFINALAHLAPKFVAWILSFRILAVFWMGHQRAFHHVRQVDNELLRINVMGLLFASLMPFSSALTGERGARLALQAFYAANMAALAAFDIAIAAWNPRYGTVAFILMFLLVRIGRRREARAAAQDALLTDRPFP